MRDNRHLQFGLNVRYITIHYMLYISAIYNYTSIIQLYNNIQQHSRTAYIYYIVTYMPQQLTPYNLFYDKYQSYKYNYIYNNIPPYLFLFWFLCLYILQHMQLVAKFVCTIYIIYTLKCTLNTILYTYTQYRIHYTCDNNIMYI